MAKAKVYEIEHNKVKKCCICGKEFAGFGNNPEPVKHDGECCDECNMQYVIPERIAMIAEIIGERKENEE